MIGACQFPATPNSLILNQLHLPPLILAASRCHDNHCCDLRYPARPVTTTTAAIYATPPGHCKLMEGPTTGFVGKGWAVCRV
jgi:hypothetical protein